MTFCKPGATTDDPLLGKSGSFAAVPGNGRDETKHNEIAH